MANAVRIMRCDNIVKRIDELADIVKREIEADADLVYERSRELGTATVVLLSFEQFYLRNGSYASLNIMLTEMEGTHTADIIGSGGGDGLFNFSWGANSSFANRAAIILGQHGYIEVD